MPEKSRMVFTVKTIEELSQVAAKTIEVLKNMSVWSFYGEMGAGKTTLIKEICSHLGVIDTVQSPTFGLINEYQTTAGSPVYHFDFYRLNSLSEAIDIGVEEYLYSGRLCLLEWPEKVQDLIPENAAQIEIELNHDGSRKITIIPNEQSAQTRP